MKPRRRLWPANGSGATITSPSTVHARNVRPVAGEHRQRDRAFPSGRGRRSRTRAARDPRTRARPRVRRGRTGACTARRRRRGRRPPSSSATSGIPTSCPTQRGRARARPPREADGLALARRHDLAVVTHGAAEVVVVVLELGDDDARRDRLDPDAPAVDAGPVAGRVRDRDPGAVGDGGRHARVRCDPAQWNHWPAPV